MDNKTDLYTLLPVKRIVYDGKGNIVCSEIFEYDECGNEIKSVRYDKDGNIESVTCTEYDGHGNEIKSISYDSIGNQTDIFESVYEDNRIVSFTVYDSDDTINCRTEFLYENGKLIKEKTFFTTDSLFYTYEYNQDGQKVRYTSYSDSGEIDRIIKYKYDENGNCVRWNFYDVNYNLTGWQKFLFDKNNEIIRADLYDFDGSHLVTQISEYDEYGNELKYTSVVKGVLQEMHIYEYEKFRISEQGAIQY